MFRVLGFSIFFLLLGSHFSYANSLEFGLFTSTNALAKLKSNDSPSVEKNKQISLNNSNYNTFKIEGIYDTIVDILEEDEDDKTSLTKRNILTCNFYFNQFFLPTTDSFHCYLTKVLQKDRHLVLSSTTDKYILLCVFRI